jgi:hypothetical protein
MSKGKLKGVEVKEGGEKQADVEQAPQIEDVSLLDQEDVPFSPDDAAAKWDNIRFQVPLDPKRLQYLEYHLNPDSGHKATASTVSKWIDAQVDRHHNHRYGFISTSGKFAALKEDEIHQDLINRATGRESSYTLRESVIGGVIRKASRGAYELGSEPTMDQYTTLVEDLVSDGAKMVGTRITLI